MNLCSGLSCKAMLEGPPFVSSETLTLPYTIVYIGRSNSACAWVRLENSLLSKLGLRRRQG